MKAEQYYVDLNIISKVYSRDVEAASLLTEWVLSKAACAADVSVETYEQLCHTATQVVKSIRERLECEECDFEAA